MAEKIIPYEDLCVVGFSPIPEHDARPNRVTMVFRHGDHLLFAPYRLTPAGLLGGAVDHQEVLDQRAQEGMAVVLAETIPAKSDYLLWMDEDGKTAYDHKKDVLAHISKVSQDLLWRGENALRCGQLNVALKLADRALRVDEENIYALVLGAAAYRLQGKENRVERLQEPAEAIVRGFPLLRHVSELIERMKLQPEVVAACNAPAGRLSKIAAEKPREYAKAA